MMKGRSKKMYGHGVSVAIFANCILFVTFCSMGTPVRRKKIWRYSARKVMEISQLMIDILVYVSCKFEMCIFKIAQVISENVHIAFLCVLSIYKSNRKAMDRNWSNQKPNPALKTKREINIYYK